MSLDYYYFPTSHWSRVISLVIAEKQLEPTRHLVDIRRNATFEPDYIRRNPKGVVPTIAIDGRTVCNAPVICGALDELAAPKLRHRDDPDVARWEDVLEDFPVMLFSYSVWVRGQRGESSADILADKVERAARYAREHPDLAAEYKRKHDFFAEFRSQVYDEAFVAEAERTNALLLEELGAWVRERTFIAGERFGFADAIATSILYRLIDLGKLDTWSRTDDDPLRAYYGRLQARPSFKAVFE